MFSQKYHVPVYDALEPLLNDPSVDAVCICVPSGLHSEYAVRCARAGKHIALEKPMAVNLRQADEIINACAETNVKLTVISQFRFSPAALRLKEAMDSGALGKPIAADLSMKFHRSQEYYDRSRWRGTWKMDGGGALGVIQAMTSTYPGYPRRLQVNGSKGTIILEDDRITRCDVEGHSAPVDLPDVCPVFDSSSDPAGISHEWHFRQISDLADAARTGRAPLVDQFEGRKAIEISWRLMNHPGQENPFS